MLIATTIQFKFSYCNIHLDDTQDREVYSSLTGYMRNQYICYVSRNTNNPTILMGVAILWYSLLLLCICNVLKLEVWYNVRRYL